MNIEAFFKITYGLYIISTGDDNRKNGYVANTAFQVTAEPAQIAISCNKDNFSAEMISQTRVFSLSVLQKEASTDLISRFGYNSGKKTDKFENVEYITGESGVPIVTQDSVAWFECKVVQQVDAGTHIVFIAEIINSDLLEENEEPLTYAYYRDVKKMMAPQNAPTYIDKNKLEKMEKKTGAETVYKCLICGYRYNPAEGDEKGGIEPGTKFEDLPDDWVCPVCGATKDMFEKA